MRLCDARLLVKMCVYYYGCREYLLSQSNIRGGVRFVEASGSEGTVYILLDVEYLCYEVGLNYANELCIKDFILNRCGMECIFL